MKLSYPLPYGQSEQMDVGTLPQLPKSKSLLQSEKNPQRSTSRIFEIGRVEAGECFVSPVENNILYCVLLSMCQMK